MRLPTLVEAAKGMATFERYQEGVLWYRLEYNWHCDVLGDSDGYLNSISVPVPISDAGGGAFEYRMKGLLLMRWVRKHLDSINEGLAENPGPIGATELGEAIHTAFESGVLCEGLGPGDPDRD